METERGPVAQYLELATATASLLAAPPLTQPNDVSFHLFSMGSHIIRAQTSKIMASSGVPQLPIMIWTDSGQVVLVALQIWKVPFTKCTMASRRRCRFLRLISLGSVLIGLRTRL
jgi:hypothetical protein